MLPVLLNPYARRLREPTLLGVVGGGAASVPASALCSHLGRTDGLEAAARTVYAGRKGRLRCRLLAACLRTLPVYTLVHPLYVHSAPWLRPFCTRVCPFCTLLMVLLWTYGPQ